MSGYVVGAEAAGVGVQDDDVVELQTLHLPDVGDVDAGAKREFLSRHAPQGGDLGAAQAVVIPIGLLGVAGQQGHCGARLAHRKIAQRLGKKSHGGAGGREAKRFDGSAGAVGFGRDLVRQRSHRVACQRQDLARRPVGDAQGFDRDVCQRQVPQHGAPVAEPVVEEQPL